MSWANQLDTHSDILAWLLIALAKIIDLNFFLGSPDVHHSILSQHLCEEKGVVKVRVFPP